MSYVNESCHILKESCSYVEGVMQYISEMKGPCDILNEACDAGLVDGCISSCLTRYLLKYITDE